MLKILHGENLTESRKVLRNLTEEAAKNGVEVVTFQGRKTALSEVKEAMASDTLLGCNRLVVIENLLDREKSIEKTKILTYLKDGKYDSDLIIWEEKEIKTITLLPKGEVMCFKLNRVIFQFLESLRPGNTREALELLRELKKHEEAEMAFYMLIRQFRLLIMATDQALEGVPPWQQQKLTRQARNFTRDDLLKIYQELLRIDYNQKSSKDPCPLFSRLDLLLAGL